MNTDSQQFCFLSVILSLAWPWAVNPFPGFSGSDWESSPSWPGHLEPVLANMQLALPSLVLFSPLFWAGLRSMSAVWTAPCVGTLLSSAMATGPSSRVLFCCIDSMGFLRKCAGEGVSLTGLWTLALPFQFCDFWWGTRLFSLLWKWGCWWPPPPIDVLWAWNKDTCVKHRDTVGPGGLLLPPFTRLPVSVVDRVSV